jgi:hypothetical protein
LKEIVLSFILVGATMSDLTPSITDQLFPLILVVRHFPLTATVSFGEDGPAVAHTCISKKIYALFAGNQHGSSEDEKASSSDEDDPDDQLTVASGPSRRLHAVVTASSPASAQAISPVPASTSSATRSLERSGSLTTISSSGIWLEPWVPPAGRYQGHFSYDVLPRAVYDVATSGVAVAALDLYAENIVDLANTFKKQIGNAIIQGDFTSLLSPNCSFYM